MRYTAEQIVKDERFLTLGRRLEETDPLRLFWPGSGLVMQAALKRLSARIEMDCQLYTPWMSVAVDGAPVARFPLRPGVHDYDLLTGMDETVSHRVSLTLDTQPMEDDDRLLTRILAVETDGELRPVARRPVIEFIGDSLTTGEGLVGPRSGMEWRTVWMSAAGTYAAQASDMLGADGEWVSQSGWGVYSDWNQDRRHTLGAIYPQVCALMPAGRTDYDFAAHPVDAVVINLGTNDMGALNTTPEAERPARREAIAAAVEAFLVQLAAARPGAPILWICGMCGSGLDALLERAVTDAAKRHGIPAAFRPVPPCPEDDQGSRQHPGWVSHRAAARIVADHLGSLLRR